MMMTLLCSCFDYACIRQLMQVVYALGTAAEDGSHSLLPIHSSIYIYPSTHPSTHPFLLLLTVDPPLSASLLCSVQRVRVLCGTPRAVPARHLLPQSSGPLCQRARGYTGRPIGGGGRGESGCTHVDLVCQCVCGVRCGALRAQTRRCCCCCSEEEGGGGVWYLFFFLLFFFFATW